MTRKCSHCSKTGHNSRTCSGFRSESAPSTTTASASASFRLFGVRFSTSCSSPTTISKCISLDCISSASAVSSSPSASPPLPMSRFVVEEHPASLDEFLSQGTFPETRDMIKKGVPWSEDEHKQFLAGLEKLGKGDWRGISKHFVHTRTPTQVASHAQKYFLRRASMDNKKRRSSLFDMIEGNNNKSRSLGPIATDQHLGRRRTPPSSNQQLVDASPTFDLSLGSLSNNAGHSSVSSQPSLRQKHGPVDLNLTLAVPSRQSVSSFGTMMVN